MRSMLVSALFRTADVLLAQQMHKAFHDILIAMIYTDKDIGPTEMTSVVRALRCNVSQDAA